MDGLSLFFQSGGMLYLSIDPSYQQKRGSIGWPATPDSFERVKPQEAKE
jgi:hypothetical protein